jgi:hypothetical protein
MSCPANPLDCVGSAIGGVASSAAGDSWNYIVGQFEKGMADIMKALMTFWISAPSPDLAGPNSGVRLVNQATLPLVAAASILGLLFAGGRLAWQAHHSESTRSLLRGLVLTAVIGGGAATIAGLLIAAADGLAGWIMNQGFDGQAVGARLLEINAAAAATNSSGLIFILTLLGLCASLCQFGLLLVRGGLMAIVIGTLPVAAASSVTDTGYEWFKKMTGWAAAFIVYKPAAALVYAEGFHEIGDGKSVPQVVAGFMLIIVSILALPALLRLLVPAAARMGGGRGHAGAAAVAGVAATGAAVWSGGRGGASPMLHTPGLAGTGGGAPSPNASAPTGALMAGGMPGYAAHIGIQGAAAAHGAVKAAASSAAGED